MCNQREIYKTISWDQVRKIQVRDLFYNLHINRFAWCKIKIIMICKWFRNRNEIVSICICTFINIYLLIWMEKIYERILSVRIYISFFFFLIHYVYDLEIKYVYH